MNLYIRQIARKIISRTTLIAVFLLAFHFYLVSYINSNFLASYVGENLVGVFYIISGIINILLFFFLSQILKRNGDYKILVIFTTIEIFTLLGLSFFNSASIVSILMIIHLAAAPTILFSLDIFIESTNHDEDKTGTIRGNILSVSAIALITAPLLAGNLAANNDYSQVYLLSAVFLIPFLAIAAIKFSKFKDPQYHCLTINSFISKIQETHSDKNIRSIFLARLMLEFFWIWMGVYIPIYLHLHINLSWPIIGSIFTIALLPYVLLEPLLGRLADKKLGEKEVLIAGFLVMSISALVIGFVNSASVIFWASIMLCTRIGSSGVEIMTETYFFKNVKGKDAEIISFYRMLQPIGYVLSITTAIILLSFIDLKYIFIVLAIILLFGIKAALNIKDTK